MKTPIYTGLAQSDLDFANFKALHADLSDYAGANIDWNPTTKQFDGTAVGGSGGGVSLGVWVNVKDAPYNATGNGTTDDTTAINNAIAAVVTAGGGTVFFPHGIYLCNGAFDATFHSILKIPFINGTTTSSVTLRLLGEEIPSWNAPGFPTNFQYCSTIKTTRTDGMTADPSGFAAVIAGNVPIGNALHSTYSDFSGVLVRIKGLMFVLPDDPTMGGIRLDGIGNALVEDVFVNTTGTSAPTHGTTGIWMPNAINWSISWMRHVLVTYLDTGFKVGEHLRAPQMQAYYCKTGVAFLDSMYPSWANIQIGACADGVTFLGNHTVDLLVETEHGISGFTAPLHDIKDPSNYGTGIIRLYLGHGTPGSACSTLSIQGGTGLTIHDMCSGAITLNTTAGASGGAGYIVGAFSGNVNTNQLYIGTDLRLVPLTGGGKLQARNPGTNTWADVDQWTNP